MSMGKTTYKEMTYTQDRRVEVLASDSYLRYDFVILSLGTHPTAYVRIPKTHKAFEKDYDDIDVRVHGGLTYASKGVKGSDKEGWWVGWDYAHLDDYSGYDFAEFGGLAAVRYSTADILGDVKEVIEQLKSY